MLQLLISQPLLFLIIFPGLLMSITLHEFAHSWVTDRLGDPTPRIKGRLTLDPRAHLDPLGVVAMLLTRFGWGRPAPYDPDNLKNPIRDTALIAVAGPLVNLILAGIISVILHLTPLKSAVIILGLVQVLVINVYLAIFNLIPVKPLDGAKILRAVLPPSSALEYERVMNRYGTLILILLIFPFSQGEAPITRLISPVATIVLHWLLG